MPRQEGQCAPPSSFFSPVPSSVLLGGTQKPCEAWRVPARLMVEIMLVMVSNQVGPSVPTTLLHDQFGPFLLKKLPALFLATGCCVAALQSQPHSLDSRAHRCYGTASKWIKLAFVGAADQPHPTWLAGGQFRNTELVVRRLRG